MTVNDLERRACCSTTPARRCPRISTVRPNPGHVPVSAAATAARASDGLKQIMQDIAGAITALQFQDMWPQLIAHTSQRLRNCADQLARDTFWHG